MDAARDLLGIAVRIAAGAEPALLVGALRRRLRATAVVLGSTVSGRSVLLAHRGRAGQALWAAVRGAPVREVLPRRLCGLHVADLGPVEAWGGWLARTSGGCYGLWVAWAGRAADPMAQELLSELRLPLLRALRAREERQRLSAGAAVGQALLDRLPGALAVVRPDGTVVEASWNGGPPPGPLAVVDGRLIAEPPALAQRLLQGIRCVTSGDGPRAVRIPAVTGRPVVACHLLVARAEIGGGPAALVFRSASDAVQPDAPGLLCALFGLTPGEARLAVTLACGMPTTKAMARLGIAANTLRTHLKHIFAKTGVSGRVELAVTLRDALWQAGGLRP
jgi:DNA-binding CsgD family transcriptional regulator